MENERNEYFFFWFIENYSYCWHRNGERLISPSFTIDDTIWKLTLYPRGKDEEDENHVSVFLLRSVDDEGISEKVSAKYELSFLAADGSAFCSVETEHDFQKNRGYGFGRFLERGKILSGRNSDYLPEDILTVRCKIWKGEGNVPNSGQISARSRIRVEKYSYLQIVKNFSKLLPNVKQTTKIPPHSKNGCSITSSLFITAGTMMMIEIVLANTSKILCKCEFSLLDQSGNVIECGEIDNRYDSVRQTTHTTPLPLTREDILNRKSDYLPDDKLSLICECTFSSGIESQTTEETLRGIPLALIKHKKSYIPINITYRDYGELSTYPNGFEDIKTLYINQWFTDVEVRTQTNSFPAHKIVLCARSPVFKTMMASDMKEKNTNSIHVDDLKDDVVQQLLLFLYSDNIENLQWESATQLYYAADKYQIGKLKELCSSFLVENLTPTNVVELLLLVDTHSDNNLKKAVEYFIYEHEDEIFVSKKWEALMETNPLLSMKTMQSKYKRKSEANILQSLRKKGKLF